jgi:Na+-transporting methylmalonyl-CoA/oxaloacetate decarboxylase gamma subunit
MGIVGFLIGALFVIIIRLLQGLVPAWDVGVGIVFAALFMAAFFVWGMGGFDPRMSAHGEEHEEDHAEPAAEVPAKPFALLSSTIFQLSTLLLGALIILFFVALLPFGPALTITQVPLASRTAIGFWEVQAFGQTFLLSELVVFILFFIIMMLSLLVAAGGIGWLVNFLVKGVVNAKAVTYTPLTRQLVELPAGNVAALTAGAGDGDAVAHAPAARSSIPGGARLPLFVVLAIGIFFVMFTVLMPAFRQILTGIVPVANDTMWMWSLAAALGIAASIARPQNWVQPLAIYLSLVFLLYPIFYHVAIGLVYLAFPSIGPITAEVQRVLISWINVLLIPALILRPKWVSVAVGRIARTLARFLRWVGTVK